MRVLGHPKMHAFFGCFMLRPSKAWPAWHEGHVLEGCCLLREGGANCAFRRCRGPCPKHTSVHVPRAYEDQSIRAQIIIPFVFLEHTKTRASMPKS